MKNAEKGSDRIFLSNVSRRKKLLAMLVILIVVLAISLGVGLGVGLPRSHKENEDSVSIVDGSTKYKGFCDDSICSWLGIRYAAAPIGPLRFASPQPAPSISSEYLAQEMRSICPQGGGNVKGQDEDCLFLNIQRSKESPLTVKLPVLVFFHGGGFESGSGNVNDPTKLIELSAQYNQSVVVVRINYRLGLLGFLASSEMAQKGISDNVTLNRGFQDMRMAVQWVKTNIYAFGGNASQITIWGQSAGSFGASALMLGYPTDAPFQAAILESGAPGGVPIDMPSVKDAQYQRVLIATDCTAPADHISCLRSKPWQQLRNISLMESSRAMQPATYARGFYAWTGVIDGGPSEGGFFSSRPSQVIANGQFARIPVLHGDCLDEGTIFAPQIFTSDTSLAAWLTSIYFASSNVSATATASLITQVLQEYPDNPLVGSPYAPVTSQSDRFFGPSNQFKRAASLYGDIRYQSNRRLWLNSLASNSINAYSYLYAQNNPNSAPSAGVPHGSDLGALLQSAPNPISSSYARYFLAFANTHDPSSAGPDLPTWPTYTTSKPIMLQFQNDNISQIMDNFRATGISLLNSAQALLATGR